MRGTSHGRIELLNSNLDFLQRPIFRCLQNDRITIIGFLLAAEISPRLGISCSLDSPQLSQIKPIINKQRKVGQSDDAVAVNVFDKQDMIHQPLIGQEI